MAKDGTKVAVGISTGAAIVAALAWLKTGKAQAAEGIPDELMNLVIALANSAEKVDENTLATVAAIKEIALEGGFGWPSNAQYITSLRVGIMVNGTQLPYMGIPSGMALVIKAWPLNAGWLQVGRTQAECVNINQSFPLIPSEIVTYQVINADRIWIAGTVAGCFACLTAEQRQGGGV